MSIVIDIADAVAADLNSSGLLSGLGITARRAVLPRYELADLAELRITVVPKSIEITGSTRSLSQYDVVVDVGIQQKLLPESPPTDSEVEALLDLVQQLADHLRTAQLDDVGNCVWVSVANDPIYAPDHLSDQRVFTSVLSLTYRLLR
jgi:hypothetical protein